MRFHVLFKFALFVPPFIIEFLLLRGEKKRLLTHRCGKMRFCLFYEIIKKYQIGGIWYNGGIKSSGSSDFWGLGKSDDSPHGHYDECRFQGRDKPLMLRSFVGDCQWFV